MNEITNYHIKKKTPYPNIYTYSRGNQYIYIFRDQTKGKGLLFEP